MKLSNRTDERKSTRMRRSDRIVPLYWLKRTYRAISLRVHREYHDKAQGNEQRECDVLTSAHLGEKRKLPLLRLTRDDRARASHCDVSGGQGTHIHVSNACLIAMQEYLVKLKLVEMGKYTGSFAADFLDHGWHSLQRR